MPAPQPNEFPKQVHAWSSSVLDLVGGNNVRAPDSGSRPRKSGRSSMKRSFPALVLVLILAMCPALSFGQAVFGGIAGTVSDPSGAAIPGAKVSITETSKGISYNTVTNDSGNYTQSHL